MGTLRVAHFLPRLCLLALLIFGSAGPTLAKRVAFVMGVNAYDNLEPLKKAVGDATAIRDALREQGDVDIAAFLSSPVKNEFWAAWEGFLARVQEGDEALVAISSHGLEIAGNNYLLAKDAPPARSGQRVILENAIRFGELLDDLSARKPRIALFILDACRDNPYRVAGAKSIGGERGLGAIAAPPRGAFVLYSAGVNETALDRLSEADPEPTSVYVRKLLPLLKTPGLKIQDVAVSVRGEVSELALNVRQHEQNPAYYDNLKGSTPYCFAGCVAPAAPAAQPEQQASIAPAMPEAVLPQPDAAPLTYEDKEQRLVRSFVGHTDQVLSVAFSPDGRFALSGSHDGTLKFWEIATGLEETFAGHTDWVLSVAFSPDGRFALSGSLDHTLKLWEIATGREATFAGHTSYVYSVAFLPDGRFCLSGSYDSKLKLWEIATGRAVITFAGHTDWVSSVAISPDGRFVLSGSGDETLKLWEIATGRAARTFEGHTDWVSSVAFSPDGRFALSGSADKTLRLWDVSEWTGPQAQAARR